MDGPRGRCNAKRNGQSFYYIRASINKNITSVIIFVPRTLYFSGRHSRYTNLRKGIAWSSEHTKIDHVLRFTNSCSICILFNFTCSIVSWSRSLSFFSSPPPVPTTKVSSSRPYAVLEHWTQRSTQRPMPTTLERPLRISTKFRVFNRMCRALHVAAEKSHATMQYPTCAGHRKSKTIE